MKARQADTRDTWPTAIGILSLVFVDLAICWACATVDKSELRWMFGAAIGFVFALPSVWAVFAALGPFRFGWWFPTSCALTMITALAGGVFAWRLGGGRSESLVFFMALAMQWIAVQIPLWALRRLAGWRLSLSNAASDPELQEVQFSIGQLMGWTAAVGLCLTAGRSLMRGMTALKLANSANDMIVFAVILAGNVILAPPQRLWGARKTKGVDGRLAGRNAAPGRRSGDCRTLRGQLIRLRQYRR